MKNFLHIFLLLIPIMAFPQGTTQGISYQAVAYDSEGFEISNQDISVRLGVLLGGVDAEASYIEVHYVTTDDFGMFSLVISEGETSDTFTSINWEEGAYLKVEVDEDLDGEYTLMGVNSFNYVPYSLFAENIPEYYSQEIENLVSVIDSLESIVEIVSEYFGCKDHDACNYNPEATMSNNSCTYADYGYYCNGDCIDTDGDSVCDLDEVEGCTDSNACNFVLGATNEDGSCEYNQQYYDCQGTCENDDDGDGTCDELEEGCIDEMADNYNPQALNSSNCIYSGCMDNTSGNYNPMANQDDDSCIPAEACPYPLYVEYDSTAASYSETLCLTLAVYGCTDNTALNYNSQANVDDESCENIYGCTEYLAFNYNAEATNDDESCIYYGCTNPESGNYNETANTDDSSCLIGGCMNITAENYNSDVSIDDGTCVIYGCTLSSFPNYNPVASIGDGSCDMTSIDIFGCSDESSWSYNLNVTNDNGTCLYENPKIGDIALGGIIFYIDESGEHGLISAMVDIIAGGIDPYENGYSGFRWGCYNEEVNGADGQTIGTGYQNTLDIVNHPCTNLNLAGDTTATAALVSLSFEIFGYNDWYLPSKDELYEMYLRLTFGNGGNNIGGFETDYWAYYWSSSEDDDVRSYLRNMGTNSQFDPYPNPNLKFQPYRVRPIRSF